MAGETTKTYLDPASLERLDAKEVDKSGIGPRLVPILGSRPKLIVSGSRDERIGQIATRQRGRVSRGQLLAAGLTDGMIRSGVRGHRLLPRHSGVFVFGHLAPIEWGDETAALLALGEGAVLSHRSAGALWGLCARDIGLVHVLLPGARQARRSGIRTHRTRLLSQRDVRIHLGLPLSSPARTLLDLTGELGGRELQLAYDRALVKRIMSNDDVADLLGRASSQAGVPQLRALLDANRGLTITRSEAEERFLDLLREAQLPAPLINAHVQGLEVDFLWPDQRLVVEIDGFRFHSTHRSFEHDHRRDALLKAAGFEVLRFTYGQILRGALAVTALLAKELARRQAGAA